MCWNVLYTKAKNEKKVAERLQKIGIEVFCPIIIEKRQWSDRIKNVEVPLFKSLVFIKIDNKERNRVFDIPGVVKYLFWLGKLAKVKEEEIITIKEWINGRSENNLNVERLSPGDKIIIAKGKLKDKKAIIKEIGKKKMRLILPELGFTVVVSNFEAVD